MDIQKSVICVPVTVRTYNILNGARSSLGDEFISPGTIGLYVRCQQNYELLNTFSLEKSQMLNFREIRPAGATLMFANRRAAMKYLTYSFATTKTPLIKCIWTIKSIYLILMTVRTNSDPFSKQNLKVVALSEECEVLI